MAHSRSSSSSSSLSSARSSPRLSSSYDYDGGGDVSSTCGGGGSTHGRSISLPSKPNPILHKLEEHLTKLKACEESSTSAAHTISIGLSGIINLYRCIDQAISQPATQQSLFFHHQGTCIEEMLEASSTLLDMATSTSELVHKLRDSARDLCTALCRRRRLDDERGSIGVKCSIASYICTRKTILNISKGILPSLKKLDHKFGQLPLKNQGRETVFIKALRCVSIINISLQESLLFFLATPVACKPKSSRWSVASKFLEGRSAGGDHQRSPAAAGKKRDELGDADVALRALCRDGKKVEEKKVELVIKKLEDLHGGMEGIAKGLDGMSKQLLETRSILLSIFSF